jgi:hypothetical protein
VRNRLYGLLVNTRPSTAAPRPTPASSLTLDVRRAGNSFVFEGTASPARSGVPVTLTRVVGNSLAGVAAGLTDARGRYDITIQPPPGTCTDTALTANARSRSYGLIVPAAPVAPLVTPRQPTTTPSQPTGDVHYANCDAVRAAGAAPLYRGQPGYRSRLDRDRDGRDGIACENERRGPSTARAEAFGAARRAVSGRPKAWQ